MHMYVCCFALSAHITLNEFNPAGLFCFMGITSYCFYEAYFYFMSIYYKTALPIIKECKKRAITQYNEQGKRRFIGGHYNV